MRIPNQTLVNKLIQIVNKTEVPVQIKQLIGSIIEGQVLKVDGASVTLSVNGASVEMLNQSNQQFQKGDLVAAEVMDFKEGALHVSIKQLQVPAPTETIPLLLEKLNLPVNEINKSIINSLIKYDIPITKENVSQMKQSLSEVKILLGEIEHLPQDVRKFSLERMDQPIKELLLTLLSDRPSPHAIVKESNIETTQSANIPLDGEISVNTPAVGDKGTSLDSRVQILPERAEALFATLKEMLSLKPLETDFKAIQSLLENFDFNREGLLMKESLGLTLKNLILVESTFQNEKNIADSFTKIIDLLSQSPLGKSSVDSFRTLFTNALSDDEQLEALMKWAQESELKDPVKKEIIKEAYFIKETAQAPKMSSETVSYFQLPVLLNNEPQTVALYVQKKDRKFDSEDMTLLVALETHHYDEVRCLIHKKNASYDLSFSLSEEKIKNVFETHVSELKQSLEDIGLGNVNIHFNVKLDDFTTEVLEGKKITTIDLKV